MANNQPVYDFTGRQDPGKNRRLLQLLMAQHQAEAIPASTRRDPVTRLPGWLEEWQQRYPYQPGRPEMGFDPEAAQANILPGLIERGMDVKGMVEAPVETGVGLAELAKGALQVAGAAPAIAMGGRSTQEAARRRLSDNPVALMLQGGIRELRDLVGEKGVMGALASMGNRPVDVAEMMLGVVPGGAAAKAAKAAKAVKASRTGTVGDIPPKKGGTIKLYHGSNSGSLDKVSDEGLFGGVFANSTPEAAESHITARGGVLHEIEIPEEKVLTQRALNYDLPFEEVRGALKKVASNNYLNVDDDTLDLLYSLIIEEKSVFDFVDDGKVLKALDMESFEDLGEASWKAQRLRGEVARDLGYQAVDTSDEHGTSYLVLPGSSIKSIEAKGRGQLGQALTLEARAKAARRPWGAKSPVEEFGEQVLQKHGLADLEIYEVGDDVKISMIAVPKDKQGQGIGSAAMRDIVDFADQHGKRLILTPGPIESRWGQTSTASQKRFYKKFGFIENKGDDKDFRIKDSMYRAPQELQAAEAVLEAREPLKRWMGDSTVVEPDGSPKVLYHGTRDDIEGYDLDHPNRKDTGWLGYGVYATDDAELASSYSQLKAGEAGPNIMPLYARLKNPYMATIEDKQRLQLISHNQGAEAGRQASIDFTDKLKARGHDGVILDYEAAGYSPSREYVIFDPKDLKSATGNIGTYSEGGTLINTMVPIGLSAGAMMATQEQE